MPGVKTDELQLKRARILELRLEGHTTAQIASKLQMQERTVRNNLRQAVQLVDATSYLEEMQHVNLMRLEQMIAIHWDKAVAKGKYDGDDPDLDSGHFILKIIERESKLLGLDAPKRIDVLAMVVDWAERNGFDATDVVEAVNTGLLPVPNAANS